MTRWRDPYLAGWNDALEAAAKTSDAHLLIDWMDPKSEAVRGAKEMQESISRSIRSIAKQEAEK